MAIATTGLSAACSSREPPPIQLTQGSPTGAFGPELELGEDEQGDQVAETFCIPGERRCLFENSPLYEQCAEDSSAVVRGACDPGEVCRERACVPFTCAPERPVCVGTTTTAVCDSTGRGVSAITECPTNQQCQSGQCVDLCAQAAAQRSYIGCSYVVQELPNLYTDDSIAPFGVVVANPSLFLSTELTLTDFTGAPVELLEDTTLFPPPAYQLGKRTTVRSSILEGLEEVERLATDQERITLGPGRSAVLLMEPGETARPRFLASTQPVVAYQFSPYCCNFTATNDASILLPTASLGERYRVIGYPAWVFFEDPDDLAPSDIITPYFYVVGTSEQPTQVEVTSPIPLAASTSYQGGEFNGSRTHSFTLQRGQVQVLEVPRRIAYDPPRHADFSGAVVDADRPVAVFTGHPCTFVPQSNWACDHLEEQIIPAQALGSSYVLQPLRRRGNAQRSFETTYWRVVPDADAEITFSPPLSELQISEPSTPFTVDCRELMGEDGVVRMQAGDVCEFGSRSALAIDSTAELVVAGVLSGHESTGVLTYGTRAGDPAMFLAPPVDQYRSSYSFVTPPTFAKTYISVIVPEGTPVELDGRFIPQGRKLERREVEATGRTWETYSVILEAGAHELSAQRRFGLVVYAYDDFVSYAFPGGLDLVPTKKAP